MKKDKLYRYMGYNGTITSPILLPNIDYVTIIQLRANPGKVLTNGEIIASSVQVLEDQVENWVEIDDPDITK